MSRSPRGSSAPVVAELGRPETPQETADRKAASSAAYRSSQTFRNLVAAMLVTLGVVLVIVFIVPRGEPGERPPIDLAAIAKDAETAVGGPVVVPEVPKNWRVNKAELSGGAYTVWDVTMAPTGDTARGFARIAQAIDAEPAWAAIPLNGASPKDRVTIEGREWEVFTIAHPADNGNVSYALGAPAGDDYVLIYGSLSADDAAGIAKGLEPQLAQIDARQEDE